MTIRNFFDELKEKEIICWGSGKHFKNITYPFLKDSGLIDNLIGFIDPSGSSPIVLEDKTYVRFRKKDLASLPAKRSLILIAAVGYQEVLAQIRSDPNLLGMDAVPAIYLESLYEDLLMLSAPKPPAAYRKHDQPLIPKVIHTCWFSEDRSMNLPEKYQSCLDSWKRYAPDMEIRIWNQESYHAENCLFYDQAIERKYWAFASDYARADLLRRYGGIYMDLDVEMLRAIDDLLYNDAYMSFESLGRIECGSGMGAKKGHPVLSEICKSYESRPFVKEDGKLDMSTCPVRFTKVIEQYGLIKNGGFQMVGDISVYPFEVLTGKSFDTGIIYRTDLSYTLHHHRGSWVPGTAKDAMEKRYREISEFLRARNIEAGLN